jgi:NAD(P)H-nitrite reductase large subunit
MARRSELFHQGDGCGCGCGCGGGDDLEGRELATYWQSAPDDATVCVCAGVDKRAVVATIRNGAFTAPLVKVLTGIGRGNPCPTGHGCLRHLPVLLELYGQTTMSDALTVRSAE